MAAAVILLLALLVLGVAVASFSRLRSDGEEKPIVEGVVATALHATATT